jgi:hypothetical protein
MLIEDKMRELILKVNGGANISVPKVLAILAEGATELSIIRSELEKRLEIENKEN